jgi:broad specificity phosphatase PhoE
VTRILFVRHCQSLDNAAGVLSSVPPGAGLTEHGRTQAKAAAEGLRSRSEPIAAVYSSTALRAVETAEAIAEAVGCTTRRDAGLLEFGVGEFEGSADPAAGPKSAEVLRRWLFEADLEAALPGGESGRAVVERFSAWLEHTAADHDGQTIVAVAHVGTLTLGLVSVCADLSPDDVWGRPLAHGTPVEVTRTPDGWSCGGWPSSA